MPPELARVDIDLITARDPHDHLGNNKGTILPHQLVLTKGQERKGTLMTQISGFFLWNTLAYPDMDMNMMLIAGYYSFRHKFPDLTGLFHLVAPNLTS